MVFHVGVAKKLKPFLDNQKNVINEMAKTTKEEKAARSKAVKKMNEKKVELDKEATRPLGWFSLYILMPCTPPPPATAF